MTTDHPRDARTSRALKDFLHDEAAGGVVLVLAAVAAVIWANSPFADGYVAFWDRELTVGGGGAAITEDLQHWVNDGLMALFFFVVGLEIKRELVTGELRDRRAATLPAVAAVGGFVLPAVIFLALAPDDALAGWGIPVATDIAFAVGVLALLGSRVPAGAKLLLLTVAIVDDIMAITVIAAFYTDTVALAWLAGAVLGLGVVVLLRRLGVTAIWPYVLVGVAVWVATLESGVHATIAGVALGLLTPTGRVGGRDVLDLFEHRLHPVSVFLVVPLFALANAGVDFRDGALGEAMGSSLTWAVALGLLLGKVVGVGVAVWLCLRTGVGRLPEGVERMHVLGVAAAAGIGFTVSLFISELAYDDAGLVQTAKVGIFTGSLLAALLSVGLLLAAARRESTDGDDSRAEEAAGRRS
ncbi:Na+/H+ antiporter NhaA [Phycicoccus sp. BSK3Z-2]|uniref:Na(+)/H(+) antiporter NhaA n=1 Tax=Phycicoccus avicenniae TaxID=2828860 RepID=A0A941D545_9MICO|nr:Na+/H+ antiporter NhaA [Phycicoccus avicenniae]MBR7742060.1 Na+/H+ antiporter NhaA [Phycicoccus avicenniae]